MKRIFLSLVGFSPLRDNLKTEVLAGLTTFATMSYILALLPAMFSPLAKVGFPIDTVFTATALATIVGTLLMAFVARKPFGQRQDFRSTCSSSRPSASQWAIRGSLPSPPCSLRVYSLFFFA